MKILYLHHEYGGRYERYGEVMTQFGHEVDYIPITSKIKPNQVFVKHIQESNPDLIWLLSPFYISHKVITDDALDYIKSKKIPIAIYSTLNTQIPYPETIDIWKQMDFIFANNKSMAEHFQEQGLNSHYVPLACYLDQYYPVDKEKKWNVSFMGSPQTTVPLEDDRRIKCIKSLQKYGIIVFGDRFNKRNIRALRFSNHREQREVYSRSKINLDLPYINSPLGFYKDLYHVKNRFFEIPATNNFMVTGRCDDFLELLDETMVGYYDGNSIESLQETVERYLKDDFQRKQMSERSYKVTKEKHTYWHRFRDMFEIINRGW